MGLTEPHFAISLLLATGKRVANHCPYSGRPHCKSYAVLGGHLVYLGPSVVNRESAICRYLASAKNRLVNSAQEAEFLWAEPQSHLGLL